MKLVYLKNIKYVFPALLLIALIIMLWFNFNTPQSNTRCSGEILFRKKITDTEVATLHSNVTILLYNNKQGAIINRGDLQLGDRTYVINREIQFSYADVNNDGIYSVSKLSGQIHANDDLPDSLSQFFSLIAIQPSSRINYISVTNLHNKLYLIHELSEPIFICRKF